jgi:hypothetical protein
MGMSKTTARAILLFKDVIEVAIEGKDQIVIGSREIKNYLTNHIQPEYRVGDVSNFRKVKKDVLTTFYWIRRNMEKIVIEITWIS